MTVNATKTEFNVRSYLESERNVLYGMYMGLIPGGFSQVTLNDRSYYVNYIIDEKMNRFFIDVDPKIVCEKPYRMMMHAYVNEKTSKYKAGRVIINSETGEVTIRVETTIIDSPASVEAIKDMEHLAICVCEGLEKRLEKLAHGIYFNEDDPDVISVGERIKNSLSSIGDGSKPGRSFEDFLKMLDSRIRKGVDATGDDVFDDSFDDADDDIDAEFNDVCDELGDDADAFSDISFAALFPEDELA